ncbi:nuclease-like protein [Microterricola gilva]|uniref:Nuclease-like protein n=1 Tax=Microterricola gilva TaxID=393267 RepID=A0A4Q8APL7_9MICO|nr:nuclease-related domain-containing protein [Microterricola gilva]RZU66033.1 nuclease-like protein [Microterricola gilva]
MATTATMRDRFAGQLVIDETLRRQLDVPPRTTVQRFFGSCPLSDDARPWYLGAVGEIAVGDILERLPDGWSARHALPIGTKETDIDHLVIGPGGVFTINTKHHAGQNIWVAGRTVLVDGQREQHIPKAEGEAGKVARLLGERMPHPVPVHPLIVFVDPKRIMVKAQPERVRVLNSHEVRRWLKQQPDALNPAAVSDLLAIIDDPALWRATDAGDPAEARRQFAELHDEVRSARGRRRLWALAGMAGLLVLAVGALALLPTLVPLVMGPLFGQ